MSELFPSDVRVAVGGLIYQRCGTFDLRRATAQRGGEEMAHVFARAGTGSFRDRDGTYRNAAADVERPDYFDLDGDGIAETPVWLLEPAITNSALGSNIFADSSRWTDSAQFTITAQPSCIQGQTAYKHTWVAGTNWRSQTIGTFVNGQTDCFWAIVENVDATITDLIVWDNTASAVLALGRITWATKAASVVSGAGTCGVRALGAGRYLVWITATGTGAGTGANGNGRRIAIYPSGSAAVALSSIIHHAQFETGRSFPSASPIVTAGATVTRNNENPTIALGFAPLASGASIYSRFIELGSGVLVLDGPRVIRASGPSVSNLFVSTTVASANYRHRSNPPGGGENTGEVSLAMTQAYGDVVELNARMYTDGRTDLQGAKAGGAIETTAKSNAPTGGPGSGPWTELRFNSQGAASFVAPLGLHVISVAPGIRDIAEWRRFWGLA